jgi:catecholate siderophore receptor
MKDKSSSLPAFLSSREVLAITTFLTAGHAAAQAPAAQDKQTQETSGDALPEVQVTANRQNESYKVEQLASQKFTAPLLDTPQTFSVIPKEVFTQQGARNLTDVLKNVPGISFEAGENGFSTGLGNFNMRGSNTAGSIFVDGVRDSGSYLRETFNLEQVEVAKGPAADNGRGTAGGYINLITKTPGLNDFYAGSASFSFDEYGTDGNFRTTFDVNQSLTNSPLEGTAIRLNALFQEGGAPGRRDVEKNSWGLAPSIAIGLGTPTRFTLAYQHVQQNDIPDWGVPTGYPNAAGAGSAFNNGDAGFLSPGSRGRRDVFYGTFSDYDDIQSDTLTATFEHDFASGAKLVNQTRVSRLDQDSRYVVPRNLVYVAPGNPANGSQTATTAEAYARLNESITNQTSLVHEFQTGAIKHTLAAGLELAYETSDASMFGTPAPGVGGSSSNQPTGNPDPDRVHTYPTSAGRRSDVNIESYGAYLYDTVEFNPQWQLTGGFRVEHFRAHIKNPTLAAAANRDQVISDTTLGGKLGLVYKPQDNGSIYASAGISALPPGSYLSNPDISRTGDNSLPNYKSGAKPQQNFNLELGTKWELFNDRLSASAALFYTEKQNIPVDTPGAGAGAWEYTDQELYGLELGLAGQITDKWSVIGGLLLMDSRRKNNSNVDNFRQASDGGAVDGDELAYTPNISASLWTTYAVTDKWTLGAGLQYVGESVIGRPDDAARVIPNDQYGDNSELPDYIVFNAMTSYKINENVTVRLNIDNVFDELYAVSSNWGGTRAILGAPRTYTISADWKF